MFRSGCAAAATKVLSRRCHIFYLQDLTPYCHLILPLTAIPRRSSPKLPKTRNFGVPKRGFKFSLTRNILSPFKIRNSQIPSQCWPFLKSFELFTVHSRHKRNDILSSLIVFPGRKKKSCFPPFGYPDFEKRVEVSAICWWLLRTWKRKENRKG